LSFFCALALHVVHMIYDDASGKRHDDNGSEEANKTAGLSISQILSHPRRCGGAIKSPYAMDK